MRRSISRLLKWTLVSILVIGVLFLAVRSYRSLGGPALQPWHTFVPAELSVQQMDAGNWAAYVAQEERIMASIAAEVSQKLPPESRVPINRYFTESPVYPARFAQNWNRSYVMEPDGKPSGVVVLLHGLTDSPYSLRHVAKHYRDQGFVAIGVRLPAHGTVPAGLSDVRWEDWMAATRLAIREARARVPAPAPLHLVGFSNGGALAMKYSLDALEDPALARADRVVLFTPMIGITRFARFAGLASLPALLPPFANAAWLSVIPEFNPFKYNSFPVNGARQSFRLTDALQAQIQRLARARGLGALPPVLPLVLRRDRQSHAREAGGLPVHRHRQRERRIRHDRRAKHRPGPAGGRAASDQPALPARDLLAIAPGDPDPDGRSAVRAATRPQVEGRLRL